MWKKEVSFKAMLAFEEKSVFEESGFPLEKEEQALKETSLKRG